jgi:hypothetical protein
MLIRLIVQAMREPQRLCIEPPEIQMTGIAIHEPRAANSWKDLNLPGKRRDQNSGLTTQGSDFCVMDRASKSQFMMGTPTAA